MKSFFYLSFLIGMCSFNAYDMTAQRTSSSDSLTALDEKSYLFVDIGYSNDWIYMGRKDSLPNPYLTAGLSWYDRSGFFITSSLFYLTRSASSRIDLFTIGLGYDYETYRLSTGIAASGYFYNPSSYNVQSEMSAYLNGYITYDFNLIQANVASGIGFSSEVDGFVSAGIFRDIYLTKNFELQPSFLAAWGTQNYYDQYYQNRSSSYGSGKGKGKMQGGSTPTASVLEDSKFELLNYEFALNLAYTLSRVRFNAAGTYALPQNPAELLIEDVIVPEDIEPSVYWSVGVTYILLEND
ncbi:MAG: hypothetical protein RIM99_13520 [Cyclobacteriaceae bacterium]